MSSFPNVLHIAGPCNEEPLHVRASKVALEVLVSVRAVHDEHLGREARNDGNWEVCWRCGKEGRLRMAVIAARGWSMVWFLDLGLIQSQLLV